MQPARAGNALLRIAKDPVGLNDRLANARTLKLWNPMEHEDEQSTLSPLSPDTQGHHEGSNKPV